MKRESFIHEKTHDLQMTTTFNFLSGYVSAMAAYAASFFLPISWFLAAVLVMVFCDLYTGTKAARKRGETIHSKGLRRSIEKIVLYFIAIILAEIIRKVFIPDVPVTYLTSFFIAITEFQSNIENIEAVTGVNVWNQIKGMLKTK